MIRLSYWSAPASAILTCICCPLLHFLQAPSFKHISSNERLLGPPNIANNLLPLRVVPLERAVSNPTQLQQLLHCYKGSKYFLALKQPEQIPWWDFQDRCAA